MIESAETRPRWPAWYGLAALGMALVIAVFASAILFSIVKVSGADITSDSPGVNVVATLIQDLALAGCAIWLAGQGTRPRAGEFRLRGGCPPQGGKWGAGAVGIYFVVSLI